MSPRSMVLHALRISAFALTLTCVVSPALSQNDSAPTSDDLFVFRPDTPERQVRGAILAEKLDRPGLAQGYLSDLMDSQPSTEELRLLRRKFGVGTFLKLSSTRELQPTSRELLKMINEASREEMPTATTVETLINELGQSDQQTLDASLKILAADSVAVVPLLAADTATPEGDLADRLLKKYVRRFRPGLLEALPDTDVQTQARILNLLAAAADPTIVTNLVQYRFSESSDVAAAADSAVRTLSRGAVELGSKQEAVDGLLDDAAGLMVRSGLKFPSDRDQAEDRRLQNVPADQPVEYGAGFLSRAVALTDAAVRLSPDDSGTLAVKMAAELAEQSWPPVWPGEIILPELPAEDAQTTDVDMFAMQVAAETGNTAAILSLLRRSDVAINTLVQSPAVTRLLLMHSDSRVRLLTAGLLKNAGVRNRRIVTHLDAAINGSEKSDAVVIDSRRNEGPTVASVINGVGYATKSSRTGQGGFDIAAGQLHCELILVHTNCLRWSLSHTIANLRADYRLKNVPIVIYGPERDRQRTELTRSGQVGIWWVSEPISDEISNFDQFLGASGRVTDPTLVIERFRLKGIPRSVLSEEERRQMIAFARSLQ